MSSAPDINPRQESILARLVELSKGRDNYDFVWQSSGQPQIGNLAFRNPLSEAIPDIHVEDVFAMEAAKVLYLETTSTEGVYGRLTRLGIDAIQKPGGNSSHPSLVTIGNMVVAHQAPAHPSLTPLQQTFLREIVKASRKAGSELFTVIQDSGFSGIIFCDAGGNLTEEVAIGETDLLSLHEANYIFLNGEISFGSGGRVQQSAFSAVDNFASPAPAAINQVYASHVQTNGGAFNAVAGNQNQITNNPSDDRITQLIALTAELIGVLKAVIPDQAEAAARDADELTAELQKPKPDIVVVEHNARSMWHRISTVWNATAAFAEKASKVADAAAKYGPWLTLVWTAAKSRGH